ncbi:MAG: hypothetical protein AB1489_38420 [Acidobacteriota bacterium]
MLDKSSSLLLIVLFSLLTLSTLAASVLAQSTILPQDTIGSTSSLPMTQEEVMARVRNSRAKGLDFDDVAAEIDRRGINFEVDTPFANLIQFMRASVVTNALWRADDRRKALTAKPNNIAADEVQNVSKRELNSLPFIEQARAVALAYVDSLPNFVVREQVQRYERAIRGSWKLGDYLELAVSYSSEKGEEIKLKLQNGKASSLTFDQVGGLTSTGQFAGQLALLFRPESKAEFIEQEQINFYGQPCVIYSYRVAMKNSYHQLKVGKAQVTTGYRGRIFIQRNSKQILRMEVESVDIPPDFPISEATSVVDFGWVKIGDKDFLLPVSGQVSLTSKQDHYTALNCITFNKYGKFETDVKIVE